MTPLGRHRWALGGGWIPAHCCGFEPTFTSRDTLAILNTSDAMANVRIRVFYERYEQIGPYRVTVAARRLRHLRVNDLIFPEAVRLEEVYGLLVDSDAPIVVQFTRMDTRARANAGMLATAWPSD
jgi:hypothetical protein